MERSIFEWSVRAVLMAMGTALVVSILRVRAASALHRAWSGTLLAMLLLPAWTQWGPSVTAPLLPAVREQMVTPPENSFRMVAPAIDGVAVPVGSSFRPEPQAPEMNWPQFLFAVYLLGFGTMLARLIAGTLRVRAMLRDTNPADGFVTSARCAAPVTVGWMRPILLLPDSWQTWPVAKLEAVLIHEREHIRRRDPLVQWLALFNRCVFWFHPLAWWLERKLAALAEEACDAAVLSNGHAAHDYARYLIEIARSVNEKGARIRWAGAVAFADGKLPRRVRRIMDVPLATGVSRVKSIASAGACAGVLATFLACNVGRPSERAQGQPTMAEQEQRDRARLDEEQHQRERQKENAALWDKVLNTSADGARLLLEYLKAHPDDQTNLQQLVRYYQSRKDVRSLDELTLWFIAQHPDMRENWGNRPIWDMAWDHDGFERGRELWIAQLKQAQQDQSDRPFLYMNAAEFLAGSDNERAEQIILEARQKYPATGQYSGLHWEMFLAHLYAWALAGTEGPMTGYFWNTDSTAARNDRPYAQKVRAKLLASNDVELLNRTAERLQGNRPNLEFAQALNQRAISLQPDNRQAHGLHDVFQRSAAELRAKASPANLSDADRIVLLMAQLNPVRRDKENMESKARELMSLASRNQSDPNYGTAIFFANTALGEAALLRGDKSAAAKLLLAASEAPPTDRLRSRQIDMSLARKLVDAGEREAVATFLERCAKFNKVNRRLTEWAAEIRKGINPDLTPNADLFRKAG